MPVLSNKEHQTATALAVLLYATHKQLYRYLPYAPAKIREATAGLVGKGYVFPDLKQEVRQQAGAIERIYTLSLKGKEYVRDEGMAVLPGKPLPTRWHFQHHVLSITDLILTIKDYCTATGSTVEAMEHDLFLKRSMPGVRPDLWTQIGNRFIWWEVDLGTEREPKKWQAKMQDICLSHNGILARFNAPTFTVAVITTTPERAVRLAQWTREALAIYPQYRGSFRFTIRPRMDDPVNFLDGEHWLGLDGTFGKLIRK